MTAKDSTRRSLLITCTLSFLSSSTCLATPPHTISASASCELNTSLNSFRAHALGHSPLVAEIDSVYAASLAQAIDTELLANPELSFEQTYTRMRGNGDNDPQVNLAFSQPLKLSNFGKRDKVAELLRKAGDTEKNIKLLEFMQNTTVNYHKLYSIQETVRLLQQAERDASARVATVQQHVKAGLLSQGSEALFQGEKYRLEAQRAGAEATLATLQSELSSSIGTTCKVIATQRPPTTTLSPLPSIIDLARASRLSEKTRLDIVRELTTEQARLAELDAYPIVAPRFVYQHTNDGYDYYGAGITIPFPAWNRNQAAITRTSAEREVADRKSGLLNKGAFELQISNAHAAAVGSARQVEIYITNVEPAFRTSLLAQEQAYASGKGSVLEVWQTFRALNEAQLTALSLLQQAALARARLSILVGEEV